MTKEDWKKGRDKCSGCGKPKSVICSCEIERFRENGEDLPVEILK